MRGHVLTQAIARANRVFKDKPGGPVVDDLSLVDELKRALPTYTEAGGTGSALDQSEAVALSPDKQERATQTVLEQAEVLSAAWAAA